MMTADYVIEFDGSSSSYGHLVPLQLEDGVGYFDYTNPIAGPAVVNVGGWTFKTNTTSPVEGWVLQVPDAASAPKRQVVLRFERPSGVPPKGTIAVDLPTAPGNAERKQFEIQGGEVRFEIPIGRAFAFGPASTLGYWFERKEVVGVHEGAGPMVISVPVVPAGAVYAEAVPEQDAPAGGVLFTIIELKKSPRMKNDSLLALDSSSASSGSAAPARFVAAPLPLDGTYVIMAHRGNNFCGSEPITLTEQAPDKKIQLRFRESVSIAGQVLSPSGKPVARASVGLEYVFKNSSFGLASVLSDEEGRFQFEDCNAADGNFTLTLRAEGLRSTFVRVNMKQLPISVRLEPGLKLSGRVVDQGSDEPVAGAEVRVYAQMGELPSEVVRTDAKGRFEFNTLGDAEYRLFTKGSDFNNLPVAKPGTDRNITINVKR